MPGTIVESMRLLGQISHALDNIAGKGIPLQEPMVTISMSEYERLKAGIPAAISGNHIFDAEMNRLMMRNAELQEENSRLRQELENLKNRKWRIFR